MGEPIVIDVTGWPRLSERQFCTMMVLWSDPLTWKRWSIKKKGAASFLSVCVALKRKGLLEHDEAERPGAACWWLSDEGERLGDEYRRQYSRQFNEQLTAARAESMQQIKEVLERRSYSQEDFLQTLRAVSDHTAKRMEASRNAMVAPLSPFGSVSSYSGFFPRRAEIRIGRVWGKHRW